MPESVGQTFPIVSIPTKDTPTLVRMLDRLMEESYVSTMTEERSNTSDRDGLLDELLPIGEVAKAFGVTVATVRNWDRDGRIESVRTPGGQRRFRRSEVDALLDEAAS